MNNNQGPLSELGAIKPVRVPNGGQMQKKTNAVTERANVGSKSAKLW